MTVRFIMIAATATVITVFTFYIFFDCADIENDAFYQIKVERKKIYKQQKIIISIPLSYIWHLRCYQIAINR